MSQTAELDDLFRALTVLAAARALPKLAERARAEESTYERFAEALLSTETSSRESHGGESRIRSARFPSRKTLVRALRPASREPDVPPGVEPL
jgi:DNA replication protein DnaC